jgi:DNA-directed RNA polymerase specialized sigma24 family protein
MSAPADRPIWEQHPLWLDRERLEAICQQMWFEIQKVMFPGSPRRPLRRPGTTELSVVGGASVEDVFGEALPALLRYEPKGDVVWEAVGITIAQRRAVAAVRKAKKHRSLPDGSEIDIASLDLENEEGGRLVEGLADSDALPEDKAIDRVLRTDRLVAFREVAEEVLPQRDRDIVFRVTRGETNVAIANDVSITEQRVGQVYRESMRKINARLRSDPAFRRLYEPEGGNPNDR